MEKLEQLIVQVVDVSKAAEAVIDEIDPESVPESLGRARDTLATALSRLEDSTFDVAVVGEMNSGKSTLLNALNDVDWFPSSPTTCTAKLTRVDYADTFSARVRFMGRDQWRDLKMRAARFSQGGSSDDADRYANEIVEHVSNNMTGDFSAMLGTERTIDENEIQDYVAKDGRYTGLVDELTISGPHPFGPRVRIVDTPGLLDPDESRAERTRKYLSEASVVVVVLYAGAPMGAQDYQLLRNDLVGVHAVDRILVALNKMDSVPAEHRERVSMYVDEKLDNLRSELTGQGKLFMQMLGNAKSIPVSGLLGLFGAREGRIEDSSFHESRLAGEYGFNTYAEAWQLSGMGALKDEVLEVIERFDGSQRLQKVLRQVKTILGQVDAYWQDQKGQVASRRGLLDADLQELEEKLRDSELAIARLKKGSDRLRGKVRDELRSIRPKRTSIQRAVKNVSEGLRRTGEREIAKFGRLDANSSECMLNLANDLAWEARETSAFEALAQDFTDKTEEKIPNLLSAYLDETEISLSGLVDRHVVDRVRYAHNADPIELPEIAPPSIGHPGFWRTLFKPGQARAELTKMLGDSLRSWEKEAATALEQSIKDLSKSVQDEYIDPALNEIENGLKTYKEQVESELGSRKDQGRSIRAELKALDEQETTSTSRLNDVQSLLDRADELAAEVIT